VTGALPAAVVFDAIVEAAWETGDPGLLFLDAIQRANPAPELGEIEATNPCGEVPLVPNESCTLASINLARLVRATAEPAGIDWERLRWIVHAGIRMLDDVIDVNRYPSVEFADAARLTRKVGLGVMGFADLLIRLAIPYDSDAAVSLARQLMTYIAVEATRTSQHLGEERGPCRYGSHPQAPDAPGVRNATRTAIAPTGTLSILAGTSASIEPLFALAYRRTHALGGPPFSEIHPLLEQELVRAGVNRSVIPRVAEAGTLKDVPQVPERLARLFATALEIPPARHLQIQAAFQRHVDNSVSKTINLPHEAGVEDVAQAYRMAWSLDLKGVTVYRYGCGSRQMLDLGLGEEPWHVTHASKCDPEECRI
jgi:ribonucleoside-diphosphate reductase alpha chain